MSSVLRHGEGWGHDMAITGTVSLRRTRSASRGLTRWTYLTFRDNDFVHLFPFWGASG
jgi:hypothetical protein